VRGTRVFQLNRRRRVTLDETGVVSKFGVSPESIPIAWRWSATRQTATALTLLGREVGRLRFSPSPSTSNPSWGTYASGA
jgi:hypothetical protein